MITAEQMKKLEDRSEKLGVSKLQLMEKAGKGLYQVVRKRYPDAIKILVAAYHGNNGGDGFVAARYLCNEYETDILFIGDKERLKEEGRVNFRKIRGLVVERADFDEYDVIIDALLGTGIRGRLKGKVADIIERINQARAAKISVDIPSGMDPDTGEIADVAVDADLIVCFHDIKQGLSTLEKKVVVVDIGII